MQDNESVLEYRVGDNVTHLVDDVVFAITEIRGNLLLLVNRQGFRSSLFTCQVRHYIGTKHRVATSTAYHSPHINLPDVGSNL